MLILLRRQVWLAQFRILFETSSLNQTSVSMPEWGWSTLSLPRRHAGLLERCSSKSLVGSRCVRNQLSTLAFPFLKRLHCTARHEACDLTM